MEEPTPILSIEGALLSSFACWNLIFFFAVFEYTLNTYITESISEVPTFFDFTGIFKPHLAFIFLTMLDHVIFHLSSRGKNFTTFYS